MNAADYPALTIIMRGYTYPQAAAILQAMTGLEDRFAVEMTLNTKDALEHIQKLTKTYGAKIKIGAGTVRSLQDAQQAYQAGAQFLLGPHKFTQEMLDFAKEKQIVSVPAAMTPSEVASMFNGGADIVKVFPAAVVTPRFFKDIQAPLGKLPLMAVGGISRENAREYLACGASFLGIGSGMFRKEDIEALAVDKLSASLKAFAAALE